MITGTRPTNLKERIVAFVETAFDTHRPFFTIDEIAKGLGYHGAIGIQLSAKELHRAGRLCLKEIQSTFTDTDDGSRTECHNYLVFPMGAAKLKVKLLKSAEVAS